MLNRWEPEKYFKDTPGKIILGTGKLQVIVPDTEQLNLLQGERLYLNQWARCKKELTGSNRVL